MSYLGGGPYYIETCPLCGELMWNGQCENLDCEYHWHPKEDDGWQVEGGDVCTADKVDSAGWR